MNGYMQAAQAQTRMPMPTGVTNPGPPNAARFEPPPQQAQPSPEQQRHMQNQSLNARLFMAILNTVHPELAAAQREKRLTPAQSEQLKLFAQVEFPKLREEKQRQIMLAAHQQQLALANANQQRPLAATLAPSAVQPPQSQPNPSAPPRPTVNGGLSINVNTPPASSTESPASTSQAVPPSMLHLSNGPGLAMPVAGVKRKSPPPSSQTQNTHQPPGPPAMDKDAQSTPRASAQTAPSRPAEGASAGESASEEAEAPMDPGPQPWPNSLGSRPTLTGGLGGMPLILSTPSHLSFPQIDPELLEAALLPPASTTATEAAQRKESQGVLTGPGTGSKKTVREIVGSIDPRVRVDGDVEDFMLELADEFIDSVIHFACKIAQHRGSDTLDVRDLQLHLESNLNLRIPGFSSDETRVSISQSAMVGDMLLGAVGATRARPTNVVAAGTSGKSKGKGKDKAKDNEKEREKDAAVGRGLRAVRMAAVRAARNTK